MNATPARWFVVAALLLFPLAGQAQERSNPFGAKAFVTVIELVVDVKDANGRTPADLTPADFTIVEGGVTRQVVSVEFLGGTVPAAGVPGTTTTTTRPATESTPAAEWQTVIWIDGLTSSRGTTGDDVVRGPRDRGVAVRLARRAGDERGARSRGERESRRSRHAVATALHP
jgi:hypothetical protein